MKNLSVENVHICSWLSITCISSVVCHFSVNASLGKITSHSQSLYERGIRSKIEQKYWDPLGNTGSRLRIYFLRKQVTITNLFFHIYIRVLPCVFRRYLFTFCNCFKTNFPMSCARDLILNTYIQNESQCSYYQ